MAASTWLKAACVALVIAWPARLFPQAPGGLPATPQAPGSAQRPPARAHDADPHGHTSPHDGFVEVLGEGHVELTADSSVLRLYRYDVSMNQLPVGELRAACFLDPCGAMPLRIALSPSTDASPSPYLEGAVPESCAEASTLVLRAGDSQREQTFRYKLPAPLWQLASARPALLGSIDSDNVRVQILQRRGAQGFPGPVDLELRFMDRRTLAPLDLRHAPSLRYGAAGVRAGFPLVAPARLETPGRWRLRAYLPPAATGPLEVGFRDLQDRIRKVPVSLSLRQKTFRSLRFGWIAVALAAVAASAGIVSLVVNRLRNDAQVDLLALAGLEPLMRAGWFPGLIQWPLFVLFLLVLYGVFEGPAGSTHNPAVSLLLGFVLPALVLTPLATARGWCSVCPFTVLIDLIEDFSGPQREVSGMMRRHWGATAAAQLALLLGGFLATGLLRHSLAIGAGLLFYLALAAAMALRYNKRAFCRVLCPAGAAIRLFAFAAPFRMEPKQAPGCCKSSGPCTSVRARPYKVFGSLLAHDPVSRRTGIVLPWALLGSSMLLLVAVHPRWPVAASARFACAVALVFLPVVVSRLSGPWLDRAGRGSSEGDGRRFLLAKAPVPLAFAAACCWALPALLGSLPALPVTLKALLGGESLAAPVAPGVAPDIVFAVQCALILSGLLFSAAAGLRILSNPQDFHGLTLGHTVRQIVVLAAFSAAFLWIMAGCFDVRFPVDLIVDQGLVG